MVRFYPRELEVWKSKFDFSGDITLVNRTLKPYKEFYDRAELIKFLRENGPKLDNSKYPLEFNSINHHYYGYCHVVKQIGVLGWMIEK